MHVIGYVSDENYVALPDVALEFASGEDVVELKSTASGAVFGNLRPARYRVTLAKPGFGPKRVEIQLRGDLPHQFRMLSDRILGYAWPKWARSGEASEFRIHSPEPYRLSLWRHGLDAKEVRLLGWFDEHGPRATVQVTPDGDYTQTGVEWNKQGYGNPVHKQYAVAPNESGLYFFHVEGESGAFFSFPWVVAPDRPRASIAVLASTNTWNAYNNFGGRSNYINAAGLLPTPTVVSRLDLDRYADIPTQDRKSPDSAYPPLSFDRPEPLNQVTRFETPTDPIRGRQPCHLAAAEWRLLSWLEGQSLEYDLYSDAHLHDTTLDLNRYRILILNAHPEYWSRTMFRAVGTWVEERGGCLMYLGGNGLDCEVEFVDASSLHFLTQDPAPGGPYDSRMHRTFESPASLLGVAYTESGAMTGAPYRVTDADHWVYEGTRLRRDEIFGTQSLHERCPGGASGHETDKKNSNTPPATKLLARGLNPNDGGAELVCRETSSGGLVFSAGSICWPASMLVDTNVSRITRNVITRRLGT